MGKEAIILVAGMGTRLKPLTLENHKCLTRVNGKEIVYNALDILCEYGFKRTTLVVGYLANAVKKAIGNTYKGMEIAYVENRIYDETNTSYSLLLGLDKVSGCDEVYILEGDVFFSKGLFSKLVFNTHENATLLEPYNQNLDGTFVEIEADGFVADWTHKSMRPNDYVLEDKYKTINIHKFQKEFIDNILLPCVKKSCDNNAGREPLENIMREIVRNNNKAIYGVLSENEKWFEIDDLNDLKIAESIFKEDLL